MAKKEVISRTSGASKLKRRRVTEQSPPAPGHGGTDKLSYPTQQSRQQHTRSQMPPEKNVSVSGSSKNGQQSDPFMYGSGPQPATDGSDVEEDETGSEASLADNEDEPSLAAAVMAMAAEVRSMAAEFRSMTTESRSMATEFRSISEIMRELADAVRTNSHDHRDMRAAVLLYKDAVQMFVDWHKLNNMPNISPMPGFVGTGPATFAHRSQQPGPSDQGGSGQGFGPNVMYNGS